jgi:hypothetical protein
MLVPKPKNAFQSPGVHKVGLFVADAVIARSCQLPRSIGGSIDASAVPNRLVVASPDRAEPAWLNNAIRFRRLNFAADIGPCARQGIRRTAQLSIAPKGAIALKTQKADGLPIEQSIGRP